MRFLLYKAGHGNYLNYTDPAGSEAEFPIPSARREHGGSYTCRYSDRTGPAAYSEPSDPVQIIVAAAPSECPDFIYTNIVRLALSAVVLLVLGLILAEAYYSRPRGVP
ncbi:T-cell-interacting, activating receptor on myeloid cells protein 1-like isoform 1-T2 [Macrochelys suwanniensis]